MKLAILGSRGYPSTYGGYETLVRRLAPYLRDQGHDVSVYGRGSFRGTTSMRVDSIETIQTRSIDRKSLSTLTSGLSASLHARSAGCDAVLVLNCANGLWLPLLRSKRIPTMVNVDGIEWERGKWGPVARKTFWSGAKATARYADAIVADSLEIGNAWSELFGVSTTYIAYGADVVEELGSDLIEPLGLSPRRYVLAVARLVPENNVQVLLDGLHMLDTSTPVVIVGSANYGSPVLDKLEHVVRERPNTMALGHVDDQNLLAQLWFNAGVYFHGHSVGGTNPALLQALGSGCPTLAVDNRFNAEVIGHADQLLPADPEAVGAAIRDLLADPVKQDEFAARGRATISERYTWDAICEAYHRGLVGIADSGHAP